MIAKIVKGGSFANLVNYILDDHKDTKLLAAEGVRLKDRQSIIESFETQAKLVLNKSRLVGHISLAFSVQDKQKLSNDFMNTVAQEYMQKMGIVNTQYIIGRHYDKEHPHLHIAFNRVNYEGKMISDSNDRLRSTKSCKELTQKYGLYFAQGKENVKLDRLREPDKTKHAIYLALSDCILRCKNWAELRKDLKSRGIVAEFKYKGTTDEVQGVKFSMNDYHFSGSKVDRAFSFSKIDSQLTQNSTQVMKLPQRAEHSSKVNYSRDINLDFGLSDLPFVESQSSCNAAEEEFRKRMQRRKKKGRSM